MKFFQAILILLAVTPAVLRGQGAPTAGDPFGEAEIKPSVAEYSSPVDRNRGILVLNAKDGQYSPGSHFAHWRWQTKMVRWGNYFIRLKYVSNRTKLGVSVRVSGLEPVKSYAPRTPNGEEASMILGVVYIPKAQDYDVELLTGDQSNNTDFMVKAVELIPAPESEPLGQSIDGTIDLHAKSATTYAENMRYEPDAKKECLGFWTSEKDWAEWKFDVVTPGQFELKIVQGCGSGSGGSDVKVMVNDQTFQFKVMETGGFQNWKEISLGKISFATAGEHKVAIVPVNKAGGAIMDVQRIIFTPARG